MKEERSLEERLAEAEALLKRLVVRVTELELESTPAVPPRAAQAPPTPPQPVAPAAPPAPSRPTPRLAPALDREAPAPAAPRPAPAVRPPPPAPPPWAPRRTARELARDWDLMGARGFAIAGGAVMALGIGLFFILAANRGWIDEQARVALGATASALVFGAGLLLRSRYGQYWSALAAVGAGVAGAYATLAAATVRYDLVPDALALPLAGLIAAAGTVVAVRWGSQIIAAIGILGAALAPALEALDTEMTWEAAAFAVIVLVAGSVVTVPRGWSALLIAASVVVGVQAEWLVADVSPPAGAGTVAVAAAFALTLLGTAIGCQLAARRIDVDPLALSYGLASFAVTLVLSAQLFDERADRGVALTAAALVWAVVLAGLHWRRLPDLALVVGTSALALAAVGTADLLSDAALTIAWAAEALVLAGLARRLGDARLQALGIVYVALASISALASAGRLDLLFEETADHLAGVLPLAAAGSAAIGAGMLVSTAYRERTEAGLLAFVGELRRGLVAHRQGLREALLVAGAGLVTLSAAFLSISVDWEWGHVAASAITATVGAGFLAVAGRLRSDGLAAAAFAWLGVVLGEALVFDVDVFDAHELVPTSTGGWSVIAAAAGLLGGAYAHRLASPSTPARNGVHGVAAGIAAAAAALGIESVAEGSTARGLGLLAAAAVYVVLAGVVFTRASFRDVSTTLWSLSLVLLIGAELLLLTDSARGVALSATALGVGALSRPLTETRLWLAGASLGVATSAVVVLVWVQPWLGQEELDRAQAVGLAACVFATVGLSALHFGVARWRDLVTVLWATGLVALLATERVLLGGWQETTFAVALTGGALALLASPLAEPRLWYASCLVVGVTTVATIASFTPPAHFFEASRSPAAGIWVLAGCILALVLVAATAPVARYRAIAGAVTGGVALYAVSLGILELAERASTASIETDFERGHTGVSAVWALVGLGLLVVGLLRGSSGIRYAGLALFGLSLAKIFLYDLAELSSVARAFSFILVGGLLLAGGFFLQRLSDRIGPRAS